MTSSAHEKLAQECVDAVFADLDLEVSETVQDLLEGKLEDLLDEDDGPLQKIQAVEDDAEVETLEAAIAGKLKERIAAEVMEQTKRWLEGPGLSELAELVASYVFTVGNAESMDEDEEEEEEEEDAEESEEDE